MEASEKIDQYIAKTNDWRGEVISQLRKLIHEEAPDIIEEWKWNSPVFSISEGMICSPGAFKAHVGVNFFDGAALEDTHSLFNSGLDAKKTRAININKGEQLNAGAFKELISEAIAYKKEK